jgi:hypothetical protein
MSHENDELQDFEVPGDFVDRKRREGKKDHSRDKKRNDELERRCRASHKRRLEQLQEEDLDDDEEEYRHMWK